MPCAILFERASAQLRSGTAAAHLRVEQSIDWRQFFSDLASYREFLARYSVIVANAVGRLSPMLARDMDRFAAPQMVQWLEEDLRTVDGWLTGRGSRPPEWSWRSASPSEVTWIGSPAAAAGVVYVLEGSLNGGAVLGRLAEASLGISGEAGRRFLAAPGIDRGQHWRATREWLDTALFGPGETRCAVESANQMFSYFTEHLETQ